MNEKSKKSLLTNNLKYKQLFMLLLLDNTNLNLSNYYFIVNYLLKSLSVNSNLYKSLYYHSLTYITNNLNLDYNKKLYQPFFYRKVIKAVSLPFHKTKLNALLCYVINLLLLNYTTSTQVFKVLRVTYFTTNNFNLLPFLNLFYFKIRHY